ncbi:uncharacterized protein [Diadema setosum]|uniref:uncharacterized protein n=1 Tax=Diadema setosum TaxID=31175 RepID=UPI003B3B1DF1
MGVKSNTDEASIEDHTHRSRASRHIIEECVQKRQSSQNRCRYRAPSNATSVILTCVVSGFKPEISMMWTDESGERLQPVYSLQTTLSDNTYERFEKINVSANHRTEETFECVATGDAVNGTSTKEITLLPVSGFKGERNNVGLIIGLYIGLPAAVLILFLLVRKLRQKRDQDYVPERVSVELSPTGQTTMNSEDESRKWYSVHWMDFNLCCRQLEDVSSKHPIIPSWLYALYRFALVGSIFAYAVFDRLAMATLGPKVFIYFPLWLRVSATIYVYLVCFNTVIVFKKSRTNELREGEPAAVTWVKESISQQQLTKAKFIDENFESWEKGFDIDRDFSLVITNLKVADDGLYTNFDTRFSGFWGVLYYLVYAKVPIFIYVSIGLLPAVVCLSEIFLTLIVVRFVHAWLLPGTRICI